MYEDVEEKMPAAGQVRVFGNIDKDEKHTYFVLWVAFALALTATVAVFFL